MSATIKDKQEFIELRANNVSYEKIAKQLSVSKTTLIAWAKDLQLDIDNLRSVSQEALNEQYKVSQKHRLEMWSEQLEAVRAELKERGLKDVPTTKLLELLESLSEKLKAEGYSVQFKSKEYVKPFNADSVAMRERDYWSG